MRVAFAESELSKAKPEVGERPPVTHSGFIVYCLVLKMFVVLREKQGGVGLAGKAGFAWFYEFFSKSHYLCYRINLVYFLYLIG